MDTIADQLAKALEPFATIGSGFDMEDVQRGRAALAAYNSAQKAEAPGLPEPAYCLAGSGPVFLESHLVTYGQQCHEAGRQQGMEQANALWEMAKTSGNTPYDEGPFEVAASSAQEPVGYVKPEQLEILKRNGVAMLDASQDARGFCTAAIYAAPARLAGATQGEAGQ